MKWIKEITRILYSLIAHVDRTLFNINVHFKKAKNILHGIYEKTKPLKFLIFKFLKHYRCPKSMMKLFRTYQQPQSELPPQ